MAIRDIIYNVIKYSFIGGLIAGLFILLVGSALVFDTAHIVKNPLAFTFETFYMGVFTSLPIFYLSNARGGNPENAYIEFGVLLLKVTLFHIGMQLSGVYSIMYNQHIDPFKVMGNALANNK
jgi:hypothetical protein